jgi:hypothetical protein
LEIAWDAARVCLVATDDTSLGAALEQRLAPRGWRVVVRSHAALSDGGLAAVEARFGRVAAFLDVAPRFDRAATTSRTIGEELLGDPREEAWLFATFRLARELSPQLDANGPNDTARRWFVAITRLDGKLGLSGTTAGAGAITAGVYGLVKTLHQEWPSVCCRAIDLHPELAAAQAADRIVEELHDPDRTLTEIGHGLDGRWTMGALEASDA